jgi:phage tail sheath gpL-like
MVAVTQSAVARVVGIDTIFRDLREGRIQFLPQRIIVIGQGNTASTFPLTKLQVTSALQAATAYGFGSPIHEAVKQLLPVDGNGVGTIPVTVVPLAPGGSAQVATGSITATGTATAAFAGRVRVGGILSTEFVVLNTADVTAVAIAIAGAINAVLDMPVTAAAALGVVTLTTKWAGLTGNDITFEMIDTETDAGITFALTSMSGGLVSPDVSVGLAQIGNVWESLFVNAAAPYTDTTTLDAFVTYMEGRWNPLVRRPGVVFTCTAETNQTTLAAAGNARRQDRTNVVTPMPGCANTPWAMAARQVSRIARIADSNPARDYGSQPLTGLIPGTDIQQFDYLARDLLVKSGISTIEVRDGVINISDTVTLFHPTGDTLPAYRFVKTIIKLQQVIFNMDLTFNNAAWDGAPLIPNDQPTTNRDARKPKTAVTDANAVISSLGLEAIISDPATAREATVAQINSQNPDRLDLSVTVQIGGNANIISADVNFGFFFGTNPVLDT